LRQVAAALALALLLVPQAYAWNYFGHEVVAAAAYEQLSPATRERVKQLLKLNPSYSQWSAPGAADPDKVAFMMAATWPDAIKWAQSGYQNDGELPQGPGAAANTGYADHLQHRYWHYIDLPFSPDHTPLVQPPAPNALTQVVAFTRTLASAAGDDVKSYDLVWLLHLVGDVHQPLHATSRFTHDTPGGDEGGNKVSLCDEPGCRRELHGEWDGLLGRSRSAEDAIEQARKLPPPDRQRAATDDPEAWIRESFELAQRVVYASPVGVGPGPFTLDEHYLAAAREVALQQAAVAAARLAHLLNTQLR
jgi:hypothetical protein